MGIYIYDGSFSGLVCAIKAAAGDPAAEIMLTAPDQDGLFSRAAEIEPSLPVCAEFLRHLDAMSGPGTSETVKLFWLWTGSDKEKTLLAYARMAFTNGRALNEMLADPVVARVSKAALAVLREAHRLKGLLRFAELADRTLYARMEPDHDILPLIAGHFKKRMASSNWVIHDVKRGRAALYFGGRLRLAELEGEISAPRSDAEKETAGLWRAFFNSIAIRERTNPRLQRANVPLKYRGNMPEFE